MDTIFTKVAGLDVHQATVVACVRTTAGGKVERECRVFETTTESLLALLGWLTERGEAYAYAFEKPKVIRAAIDHAHVKPDAVIAGASEIAFFPPMTGG